MKRNYRYPKRRRGTSPAKVPSKSTLRCSWEVAADGLGGLEVKLGGALLPVDDDSYISRKYIESPGIIYNGAQFISRPGYRDIRNEH